MKKTILIFTTLLVVFLVGCSIHQDVSISKSIPSKVNLDQTFNFSITIDNGDTKGHELRSIDISKKFLEGVMILDTNYKIQEEYSVFGMQIHEFKQNIPRASQVEVIFTAKAVKPGDFSGDLDICVDGDASCTYRSIRIIVE